MTQEQHLKCVEIEKLATNTRALIIDRTISIESAMSEILISILSTPKTRDSVERYLFSDVLTFDQKIHLFNSLIKSGIFETQLIDINFGRNLVYIKELRNLMAHSMLDTSPEFIDSFDGSNIKFKSYVKEGTKDIVMNFIPVEENAKKGIYYDKSVAELLNVTIEHINMIFEGL